METECAHVRKVLPKYLRGHLFKFERIKIERHLQSCIVCHSQYEALKRAEETRRFLKDVTPPEGILQIVKEGVAGLARLKLILYRPLWILGIIVIGLTVYYFFNKPRQLDVELENIAKTAPTSSAPASSSTVPPAAAPATVSPPAHPAPPMTEPLLITLAVTDDKAAIRHINDIMRSHDQLRKFKFTDTVREISGSLADKELLAFFKRIQSIGKVSYNRKQLETFSRAQAVPFIMKLTVVPKSPEEARPPERQHSKPAETDSAAPSAGTGTQPAER